MIRMQASEQGVGCSVRAREEDTEPPEIRVPAAESQLMVNRAASGLALIGATGGMRCTRLCKAGMSQTGSESVPVNGEPSSVEANLMPDKRLLRYFLNSGMPHRAQQRMRITQGSQACIVSRVV